MTELQVIAIALYSLVGIGLLTNIVQLLLEAKELSQDGKTPLVGKNAVALVIASIGEALTIMLIIFLAGLLIPVPGIITVIVVFLLGFMLRNVVTYLIMWGVWALFNNLGKKEMTEDVRQDMEEERG